MSTQTSDRIVMRRAMAADVDVLNAIVHSSLAYKGAYAAMLEGYQIDTAQIARDHIVIAEDGAEALGFYSLIVAPEPELDLMFVADVAQGRGVGELLFRDMVAATARLGMREIRIVSNPPAAGFYERMGAVRVGVSEPFGRVTWSRPILRLALATSRRSPSLRPTRAAISEGR